jgi:hypothetical protein
VALYGDRFGRLLVDLAKQFGVKLPFHQRCLKLLHLRLEALAGLRKETPNLPNRVGVVGDLLETDAIWGVELERLSDCFLFVFINAKALPLGVN